MEIKIKTIRSILIAIFIWLLINMLLSFVQYQKGYDTKFISAIFLFFIFYIFGKQQHLSMTYLKNTQKLHKRIPEVIAAYGWQEAVRILCLICLGLFFMLLQNIPELSGRQVAVSQTGMSLFLTFLQTACIVPIVEEFVFRGVIYDMTAAQYTRRSSLLINIVLFGILHIDALNILNACIGGIALFELREKNNDILSCIMLHMFMNATVVLQVNRYINVFVVIGITISYYVYSFYKWYKKEDKAPASKTNLCVKY